MHGMISVLWAADVAADWILIWDLAGGQDARILARASSIAVALPELARELGNHRPTEN